MPLLSLTLFWWEHLFTLFWSPLSSLTLFWWEFFITPFSGENSCSPSSGENFAHPFLVRKFSLTFSLSPLSLLWWEFFHPFLVRTSSLWWVLWWFINQSTIHMLPNWMSGFGKSGKNKSADGYMLWPPELHFFGTLFLGTLSSKSADGYTGWIF